MRYHKDDSNEMAKRRWQLARVMRRQQSNENNEMKKNSETSEMAIDILQ